MPDPATSASVWAQVSATGRESHEEVVKLDVFKVIPAWIWIVLAMVGGPIILAAMMIISSPRREHDSPQSVKVLPLRKESTEDDEPAASA